MAENGPPDLVWILALLFGSGLVTYVWRALGVIFSGRLNTDSPVFEWVACVAYALLAGLIARMIIFPNGPLAETDMLHRIGAAIVALAIFFVTRHNIFFGVSAGGIALVLLTWGSLAGP
jgi:branched-subunit amino acid transport protein